MNLPDKLIPAEWSWIGLGLFVLVLGHAIYRAPWKRLRDVEQINVWLGACVAIMALWSIKTGVRPGLNFHLLGATLLTLMEGPYLASIGLAIVAAGITLNGGAGWENYALTVLLTGALPAWISFAIYRFAESRLPNNYFVYIFANAFFGAGISMVLTGCAITAFMWVTGAYRAEYLIHNYLPYFILMGWSEAMMSGMIMSMMVAYRPQWVSTFDDARYIKNK
jgi:uncharacterized membrane protein